MAIITLTTDFGHKDHFVAAIKGAILKQVETATIVDISHEVSPFNIQECAYLLKNVYQSFPKGTIHIIGIDAEWSPENEHIAVMIHGHYFIGADNGVVSLIAKGEKPEKITQINLPHGQPTSFPVLEIFVKVAAHLARGGTLEVVSKPFNALKEIRDFEPRVTNQGKTMLKFIRN